MQTDLSPELINHPEGLEAQNFYPIAYTVDFVPQPAPHINF
jgi:hypothetical protein